MAKSTGGSNYVAIFAMSDSTTITGVDDGDALYVFDEIETSSHTAQASGLKDITITDREYDAALRALLDVALPNDPTAGATTTEDAPNEDATGGGSASSVIPEMFMIYMGPVDATNGEREVISQVVKFDRTSEDLAGTAASTTNKVTIKLIGQKPAGTITVLKELFAATKVTPPVANQTLSPTVLLKTVWMDLPA